MLNNKPKIAILNERMLRGHGVDLVVNFIANGLTKAGYQVTVYALFTDYTFDRQQYEFKILEPPRKTIFTRVLAKFVSDMAARDLEIFFDKNIIKNIEADLFIINSYPFYPATRITKKPCLIVDYGVASTRFLPLRHKINRAYAICSQKYLFFNRAKKIITISDFLKKKLPRFLQPNAETIYLGADSYGSAIVSDKERIQFRNKHGIRDDDFLLLYVGRANMEGRTYKDLHELLEIYHIARRKNNKVKLAVVGSGNNTDSKILEENNVVPILNAPSEDMATIYKSADAYVTATKWEGFDLPLAEAQFFGKPVVAYNIGPHPELCRNGESGFLVNSKEEFVRRIIEIASDPSLCKTLSAGAKKKSQKFTWKRTVAECLAAVEKVLLEVGIKWD